MNVALPNRRLTTDARSVASPKCAHADIGWSVVWLFLLLWLPGRVVISFGPAVSPAAVGAIGLTFVLLLEVFRRGISLSALRVPPIYGLFMVALASSLAFWMSSLLELSAAERRAADVAMVNMASLVGVAIFIQLSGVGWCCVERLVRAIVLGGSFSALVAAIGSITGLSYPSLFDIGVLRLRSELTSGAERGGVERAIGAASHPIEFGVVCAVILPLAIYLVLTVTGRRRLWILCCFLLLCGILLSASRSALLGGAAGGLVLLAGLSGKDRLRVFGSVLGGGVVAALALPTFFNAIYSSFIGVTNDYSYIYRVLDYPIAGREWANSPIFGRGAGTWLYPVHNVFDNDYLLTLVEQGVVGVGAVLAVYVSLWWTCARLSRRSLRIRTFAAALGSAVVTIAIAGVTFDLSSFPVIHSVLFALIGIAGMALRVSSVAELRARDTRQ